VTVADASPVDRDTGWVEANHRFLTAALAALVSRLTGDESDRDPDDLRARMPAPPALDSIAEGFGLSGFERDVLLLCAGVELDGSVARACATAHGDPTRPYATFALAMEALAEPHWNALSPAAPLRRWHLVELDHPHRVSSSPLRVDERVLHALTGVAYLDPRIADLAEPLPSAATSSAPLRVATARLAALWAQPDTRCVAVHGRERADLRAVAAGASAALGLQTVALRAADLPTVPAERDLLVRLCERETVLSGRSWVVDIDDAAAEQVRSAATITRRMRAPVALVSRSAVADDDLPAVELRPAEGGELRTVWRDALGPGLEGWADRLAGQFALGASAVAAVTAEVAGEPSGPQLWEACRRRARPALDGLAQRVDTQAGWDDLVLPPVQTRLLRAMAAHVRHRMTVFDDWGFGARTSRGTGAAALFAGPSGTGKTYAAEVVAGELGLDLHRVDLSQVVSKYIGETEKNLQKIFDAAEAGGAVLLFDEADALFGKRSEVRDSHDRYANIEVSYLLQRMESYRGLAILTTNMRDALDTAFLRRLRFVVSFPFPNAAGRADIWRRVFPPQLPTDGLVIEKLARPAIAGGTIRNVALSAAFLAAEAGEPVRMAHVLAALRTEYAKSERPLTDAEVAGWT
jgi:hypothetical protein